MFAVDSQDGPETVQEKFRFKSAVKSGPGRRDVQSANERLVLIRLLSYYIYGCAPAIQAENSPRNSAHAQSY